MLVSFDVFDTLVCRLVAEPIDVFKILEAELGDTAPENFAALRISAEDLARRKSEKDEVTLSLIYDALQTLVPFRSLDLSSLMEAEIATEIRLCVPRIDIVKKLQQYRESGIRCVAISDMYLPRAAVERILTKCGLVLDEIYVSSEILLTKAHGTLFDHVRRNESISFADWRHYGDNYHSDVVSAVTRGISAFHTPIADFKLVSSSNLRGDLTNSIITGVVRSLMYGKTEEDVSTRTWFQVGAEYTGILSVLLCDKARCKAAETGASSIYFLARDGYVLKRVHDALYPDDDYKSVYLAASRRMINFIQTSRTNPNLKFLSANSEGLTGYELLARIGVEGRDHDRELLAVKIQSSSQALSLLDKYQAEILARAEFERGQVLKYLRHEGLFSGGASVLVDVGWFCSIQKSLGKILSEESSVGSLHGIYFGTNVAKAADFDVEGLFYTNMQPRVRATEIAKHIEVMELLFTAPEQSIVTVESSDVGFNIVRMESADESSRITAAAKICDGAISFVDAVRAAGLVPHLISAASVDHALSRFELLVRSPGREIAASIRAIKHSVGFGGSRYEPFLPDCGSVRRPLVFLRNYVRSYWKEALYLDFSCPKKLLVSTPNIMALKIFWRMKKVLPGCVRQMLKKVVCR